MDNKIRIGTLTEQERTIINFLSTDERKQALLQAGKKKMARFAEGEKMITSISKETVNAFLASDDFKSGVISATKASYGGSGYSVELFLDGTWRVLWDNQIGNKYETPGQIVGLPTLTFDPSELQEWLDDDQPEEEFYDMAFDNERHELEQFFRDQM